MDTLTQVTLANAIEHLVEDGWDYDEAHETVYRRHNIHQAEANQARIDYLMANPNPNNDPFIALGWRLQHWLQRKLRK